MNYFIKVILDILHISLDFFSFWKNEKKNLCTFFATYMNARERAHERLITYSVIPYICPKSLDPSYKVTFYKKNGSRHTVVIIHATSNQWKYCDQEKTFFLFFFKCKSSLNISILFLNVQFGTLFVHSGTPAASQTIFQELSPLQLYPKGKILI